MTVESLTLKIKAVKPKYTYFDCVCKEWSDRTGDGHVLTGRKLINIRYPTDTETRKEYAHVTVIR
ncbi:hypothetical protein SUT286_11340 [Streptococcus parasuis]|nr:hypothetical protein SUT286_11340 [Streptococcus parasuis]